MVITIIETHCCKKLDFPEPAARAQHERHFRGSPGAVMLSQCWNIAIPQRPQ